MPLSNARPPDPTAVPVPDHVRGRHAFLDDTVVPRFQPMRRRAAAIRVQSVRRHPAIACQSRLASPVQRPRVADLPDRRPPRVSAALETEMIAAREAVALGARSRTKAAGERERWNRATWDRYLAAAMRLKRPWLPPAPPSPGKSANSNGWRTCWSTLESSRSPLPRYCPAAWCHTGQPDPKAEPTKAPGIVGCLREPASSALPNAWAARVMHPGARMTSHVGAPAGVVRLSD
jgi:hypothetical protein